MRKCRASVRESGKYVEDRRECGRGGDGDGEKVWGRGLQRKMVVV